MKKALITLALALIVSAPLSMFAATLSDRVVINGGGIYGNSDVLFAEGGDPEANGNFVGGAAIYGGDGWGVLNIYLTEQGSNTISDHLFSVAGAQHSCQGTSGADCIFFSSDPSADSMIGTACTFGANFCREEDGTLQDVTDMVTAQNGGRGICCTGGSISVQSDVAAEVPEPTTLLLLGSGMIALTKRFRKRS